MDMEERKHYGMPIWSINLLFFIVLMLFITVGRIVQSKSIYPGLLITEFVLILLPALIYLVITKQNIVEVVKLHPITLKQFFLVIGISITGYCVAVFLSLIVNYILSLFGELIPSPIPPITTGGEYIKGLLVISGSAAICEEFLFRGVILSGYQKLGGRKAIIISSLMFGFMHINVQNLVGPLVIGIILGYLVYRSNSILAGMVGHFTFNSIAVTLAYLASTFQGVNGDMMNEVPSLDALPAGFLIAAIVVWMIIAIGAAALLVLFLKLFNKTVGDQGNSFEREAVVHKVKGGFFAYLPLIAAGIIIVAEMVFQILIISGVVKI
ncbi:MAG: type II CAAX endopeptidase family protein [Clostridia bacterium]|nr:type II CAAX endopeptidase family protein [Clostridia bacterium]